MLAALSETDWHNYSLFLRSDGLLVGCFETLSREAAQSGMAAREVYQRWQAEIASFSLNLVGTPDQGCLRLEEVFYLD